MRILFRRECTVEGSSRGLASHLSQSPCGRDQDKPLLQQLRHLRELERESAG